MTFAKLDDRANEHRKCLLAGAEACWFWACGLMYANRQSSRDGVIPDLALTMLYPAKNPKRIAERLVEVGLWERTEGGYRIHDYHSLNPTREQYEEYLAKARSRSAKNYQSSKEKNESSSREEPKKNSDSSGVEWSGVGSYKATTGSTLPVAAPDPVREVFEFWQADTGHKSARLTAEKRKHIGARLKDFSVEQLKQVVTNRHLSPYYMGQNDTGTVYDGVDNLFRNTDRVEKLLALSERTNGASSGTFATAMVWDVDAAKLVNP